MRSSLTPTALGSHPLDHPPLTSPTWRSRGGAGTVAGPLAVLPGMGLYIAAFVIPPTYLFGIPLATRILSGNRRSRDVAARIIGAGVVLGPAFWLLLFALKAMTGSLDPADSLWPLLLFLTTVTALSGGLMAALGTAGALWTPARCHRRMAFGGPLLLLASAALQARPGCWFAGYDTGPTPQPAARLSCLVS